MYADGLIGNHVLIETLGGLTAGVYNYMRPQGSNGYKLKDIIPKVYDYLYPPLSPAEQHDKTQDALKSYMLINAPKGMFK
jgi:hypothetical protein